MASRKLKKLLRERRHRPERARSARRKTHAAGHRLGCLVRLRRSHQQRQRIQRLRTETSSSMAGAIRRQPQRRRTKDGALQDGTHLELCKRQAGRSRAEAPSAGLTSEMTATATEGGAALGSASLTRAAEAGPRGAEIERAEPPATSRPLRFLEYHNSSRNIRARTSAGRSLRLVAAGTQVHMRTSRDSDALGSGLDYAMPSACTNSLTPKTEAQFIRETSPVKRPHHLLRRASSILTTRIQYKLTLAKQQHQNKRLKLDQFHLAVAKVAEQGRRDGGPVSNGRSVVGGRSSGPHAGIGHDYLQHCKTVLKRARPAARTRWPTENSTSGSSSRLRPPVQRLKSMPSCNQRATHTNKSHADLVVRPSTMNALIRKTETAASDPARLGYLTVQPGGRTVGAGLVKADMPLGAGNQQTESGAPNDLRIRVEPDDTGARVDEMELIKANSRGHHWTWRSRKNRRDLCVISKDRLSLCFHPDCSTSTAACRAAEPIKRNGNYYYWEIHVKDKAYGTSMMFGLCTQRQRMHMEEYCNLIGLDGCGWSLSHKGLIWHNGLYAKYTKPFPTDQPITVGIFFDTLRGEVSFFLDGRNLGVAFRGLNNVQDDLYPVVASTAKCTRMSLVGAYCGYRSLLERSCFSLLKSSQQADPKALIDYLKRENLPKQLLEYVARAANVSLEDHSSRASNLGSQFTMSLRPRPR